MKFEQNWPRGSEEKLFEILNIFPIQMHKEAKLTLPQKGQMYDHYFSNFGSPPIPNDICKDYEVCSV